MKKIRKFLLFFILIQLILPDHAIVADVGPKPTMEFEFKQELPGRQVSITSGILYECNQSNCSDAAPLAELGPQRLTCDALGCSAMAYGFSDYHRLEIRFSDGETRESNIFQTAGFHSTYRVTVRPDDLLVEAQFSLAAIPPTGLIVIACVSIPVIGAIIIGLIIFLVRRSRKK